MQIPIYPEYAFITIEMKKELYPALNLLPDGVSEFTFSNLYLFRHSYGYKVSRVSKNCVIIEGNRYGKHFFYSPFELPPKNILEELMEKTDYLKNLSESQYQKYSDELLNLNYEINEDRDNFDYLYYRKDLSELAGRSYHKKRNLVNSFLSNYQYSLKKMEKKIVVDAMEVLEEWKLNKEDGGDYISSREALENFEILELRGSILYVNSRPAAWCLGEPLAKAKIFTIHFEKAVEKYKGIYQFINQRFAQSLPKYFDKINREQDLGNEGMRQAKMTYRPCGFVNKYRVTKRSEA